MQLRGISAAIFYLKFDALFSKIDLQCLQKQKKCVVFITENMPRFSSVTIYGMMLGRIFHTIT